MNKIICILLLSFLISCSNLPINNNQFQRRDNGKYYTPSAIQKFFLSPIPNWLNFSRSGDCRKRFSPRYFNLQGLMNQYSLSYNEAIQFQIMFNLNYERKLKEFSITKVSLKEEEELFYKTQDSILAKNFKFLVPRFNRLNLIWIDPIIKNKNLKSFVDSNMFNEGHPVFLSLCYSLSEIDKIIENEKLEEFDFRILSYESYSIYQRDGSEGNLFSLDLSEFFKEKDLFLYLPIKREKPKEFKGEFKNIINY